MNTMSGAGASYLHGPLEFDLPAELNEPYAFGGPEGLQNLGAQDDDYGSEDSDEYGSTDDDLGGETSGDSDLGETTDGEDETVHWAKYEACIDRCDRAYPFVDVAGSRPRFLKDGDRERYGDCNEICGDNVDYLP